MTDQAKAPEPEKHQTKAELQDALKRIKEKLDSADNQRFGGAPERLPKARLLDARAIEEKDQNHHYRYVNTDDDGKVQGRLNEGYAAVSEAEAREAGVRATVGEGKLMKIPRGKYEERVGQQKQLAKDRLDSHKAEVRGAIEAVERELRDRHGIKAKLLIDE